MKPDTENIRDVTSAAAKNTTVRVTKLPLKRKIRKTDMNSFAKPVLTEDLYIMQNEEFSITCYMCDTYTWKEPSLFLRHKLFISSERMLHKDY
jgi:hypothetical protein